MPKIRPKRILVILSVLLIVVTLRIIYVRQIQQYNVLIISIDTLRPDHMGVYGYKKNTTPNIDKWAKDAIVFTNTRTVVPMTQPSFTALFTGVAPFKTRVVSNLFISTPAISSNIDTVAGLLKDYGYLTSAFLSNSQNTFEGVDLLKYFVFKSFYIHEENGKTEERYEQKEREKYEDLIHQAINWIDKQKNKKFFSWIHLIGPHAPYSPPEEFKCKYNSKYCQKIRSLGPDRLEEIRADYQFCQENVPKNTLELMETLYDGEIGYTDGLVGLILDKLAETGLDKKTIVILYGDHGEGFDHNYYFNHREVLYESSVKIPLIIRHPSYPTGRMSNIMIDNTDFLPTIGDLLSLRHPRQQIDGRSFAYEFNNDPLSKLFNKKQNVFMSNNSLSKFAVFDGRYKYIYSDKDSCLLNGKEDELYDIMSDPDETKDLSDVKPQKKQKLKETLMRYLSSYNLPGGANIFNRPKNQNDKVDLNNLKTLGY